MDINRFKLLLSLIAVLLLFALLVGFLSYKQSDSLQSLTDTARVSTTAPKPAFYYNFNPADSLYIFGERIPLEDAEVFERFERDFLINVNDRVQIMLYLKRRSVLSLH